MTPALPAGLTDEELAGRVALGDRAAFDRLTDRHARPLGAVLLRRLLPADAEQVLEDVLARAWRKADSFPGGSYRSWLFERARLFVGPGAEGPASHHAADVARCLELLPEAERELIRARCGVEPDVAHGRATHALARLRECVERRAGPGTMLLLPTLPEDPAELAAWLDRQVAGPDLGQLIAELSAIHPPAETAPDLAAVLGSERDAVLAGGLTALPPTRLRLLLRHPNLLGDLQDAVALAGGPTWDDRFDHPTLSGLVRRARQAVADAEAARRARRKTLEPVYRRPWFVALATTAIVLITVLLQRPPTGPRWGWTRPGLAARGDTPAEYLTALADAAAEWRTRPKESPAELRAALKQMRDGCTAVLAGGHPKLASGDRDWLAARCVGWGGEFDRHLVRLQAGRPVADVRREADATVEDIIRGLRARATD